MIVRPSFEDIYMTFALALANRSTCRRLKVGCAVVSLDFVLGGVKRVLYAEDYRRRDSLELLREHGVEIAQYLPRAVPSSAG